MAATSAGFRQGKHSMVGAQPSWDGGDTTNRAAWRWVDFVCPKSDGVVSMNPAHERLFFLDAWAPPETLRGADRHCVSV